MNIYLLVLGLFLLIYWGVNCTTHHTYNKLNNATLGFICNLLNWSALSNGAALVINELVKLFH